MKMILQVKRRLEDSYRCLSISFFRWEKSWIGKVHQLRKCSHYVKTAGADLAPAWLPQCTHYA